MSAECSAIGVGGAHSDSLVETRRSLRLYEAGAEAARLRPSIERGRLLRRRARALLDAADAGFEPPGPYTPSKSSLPFT